MACDDANPCTFADQCKGGVCNGTPLCSGQLQCDADAGVCVGSNGDPVFPSALAGRAFLNLTAEFSTNGLISGVGDTVYLAAGIMGPSDLGNGPVETNPAVPLGKGGNLRDVLVAQIDPTTLSAIWAKPIFGQQTQTIASFGISGGGQLGIAGAFQGDFEDEQGNYLLLAQTPNDQFIVGVSASDGKWLWGRRMSLQAGNTTLNTGLRAIAGDPTSGAFVVCGTANRAVTELSAKDGKKPMVWQGGKDAVVARLNGATGETAWAIQLGGVSDDTCSAVAVDSGSNTFVAGTYPWGSTLKYNDGTIGGASLGLDEVSAVKGSWTFIAKLNADGQVSWKKSFGTGDQVVSVDMIVPIESDLMVAGKVGSAGGVSGSGDSQLAGFSLGTSANAIPFLARVNGSTGTPVWINGIGADSKIVVTGMTQTSQGKIILAGNYSVGGKLGPFSLPAPASTSAFVAQLDGTQGKILVAKGYGDPTLTAGSSALGLLARPSALGVEKDTALLLTGFLGKMDFGPPLGFIDMGSQTGNASSAAVALVKLAP
jgi:hypothetical protein